MKEVKKELDLIIKESGYTLTDVVKGMNELLVEDKQQTVQNMFNKMKRGTIKYWEVKLILEVINTKIKFEKVDNENEENSI